MTRSAAPRRRASCSAWLLCMLVFSQVTTAAEITLSDVVAAVLAEHPDLSISHTDTAIAAADAQRIESLLDATISSSITGVTEQIPVASDFQSVEKRTARIQAAISKPLRNGDTLSVQGSYNRTGQDFISPFAAALARFNPEYRAQLDITYRHALLRGAERPDYSLGLQSAEAKTSAAALSERLVARTLALKALNAFFQLAANDINVDIAQQAVQRARDVLAYQRSREKFGLIEKADRLQAEALLAARNMDLQLAVAQRQVDESALNRLMLKQSNPAIIIKLPPLSPNKSTPDIVEIEPQALSQRPDIKAIDAQLQAAEADLATVRDIDAMQLDVVAQVGTRSLGSNAGVTATGGLSINDRFASLSLEMQDTLGRNNAKAAIRKAELARQRLAGQRRQTLELIRDDLAAAITAIRTGIPSLSMARRLAIAEKRKYRTELNRYREGRSDTATLVQFEGELRNAELQKRLQQLTLQLARQQLLWAKGSLLDNLNIELPQMVSLP